MATDIAKSHAATVTIVSNLFARGCVGGMGSKRSSTLFEGLPRGMGSTASRTARRRDAWIRLSGRNAASETQRSARVKLRLPARRSAGPGMQKRAALGWMWLQRPELDLVFLVSYMPLAVIALKNASPLLRCVLVA